MLFTVAPPPHGRALLALLLGLLALPLLAPALDPSLALSQYAKRHWQVEQGLPQNYVTSLAQDPSGLLIVGTSGGVARFDGVQFTPVVLDEETGISREWINSIAIDGDGRLWISSRDAGNYIRANGQSQRAQSLTPGPASALRRKNGAIVLVGGGLREVANGKLRLINDVGGGDLSWQGVMELPDGRLLVCDEDGLFAIEADGPRRLLATGPAYGRPLSLARGLSGSIFLGTTRGLFRISLGASFQAAAMRGVPGPVVSVVEDRDGQVWAATWGQGLFRVNEAGASRWSQSDGLADDFVHTLLEDREGNLWIGTRAGLSRWHSGPIVPYGPPEGLDALFVSHVAGHPKQGLWIGTWRRAMHRYQDDRFQLLDLRFPVETTLLRALTFAPGGGVWFSDWGGQLHHLPDPKGKLELEEVFDSSALGFNASVRCMLFDRAGGFWVGSVEGLFHYPDGSVRTRGIRRLAQREIRALLQARDGTIWAGTLRGLTAIRGDTATEIQQLPHQTVVALAEDSHGRVWAATRANGITLVEGNQVRVFDQRHGLPPLPVYAILEDRFERLWLSTPAGLFAVPLSQLEELIAGNRRALHPLRFLQEDGLRSIEFQNVGDPPAWRDADGHLWFSSVAGLVEVRPELLRLPDPPRVLLQDVRSANRLHQIALTTDRLNGAEFAEFRYRVTGLQNEWIPLGTQRALRLDTLPPGEHRVELAARQSGSLWGDVSTLTITQPPRWFETRWFYALCLAALAALLWAAYRWRVSLVRARFALVAEERNRIGREWHDTLLAGFSALSWQLDSARKALPKEGAQAADNAIQVAGDMLRHYRTEARQVIWDLRHSAPERENLPGALDRTLREILPGGEIAHRIHTEGDCSRLSAELSQALLRICQEAAFNAARHAEAKEIVISIRVVGTHAEATVADDGKGFDPSRIGPGHFGLSILRERASRFGGTVEIDSAPGKGTQVRARLPLQGIQRG
jgi:signal transduction histidine kinase/ligand-binding sensor domain-containing protein